MRLIPKGKHIRLCKGLNTSEFECKCSNAFCTATIISKELIKAYEKFRILVCVRLKINSGYRCPAHNKDEGGKPLSRHQTGQAIDISLKSLSHLDNSEIEFAARECGFTFVKFYKSFVHLDVR